MKRLTYILVALFATLMLLVAGCSPQIETKQEAPKEPVKAVQMVKVTIYSPNDQATGVKGKVIELEESKANPKGALDALLAQEKKNPYSVFPKDLAIEKVTVKDHIAYVDVNKAIYTAVEGGSLTERLEVASLVNTVTEFKDIQGVLFMHDGEVVKTINGHLDMSEPLKRMDKLIVK